MRGDAAVRNGGATGSLWRSRLCVVCRRGRGRVGLLNRFFNGLWRARCESVVVLELAGVKRLVGRSVSHGDKRVSHDDLWRYGSWRRRACPMAASLCCMIFALCTAGEGSSVPPLLSPARCSSQPHPHHSSFLCMAISLAPSQPYSTANLCGTEQDESPLLEQFRGGAC